MRLVSKDGVHVFARTKRGHLLQHTDAMALLPEAISKLELINHPVADDHVASIQFDMGRIVGNTTCVETSEHDEIVYARRIGRHTVTRFVRNRHPVPCSDLTMVMKKTDTGFLVLTAYIGKIALREPDDRGIKTEEERKPCIEFWNKHALIWGSQEVWL